jgi:hypothetical protein
LSFDNSRFTFDPWKNFSGVVMEQGRVQLDADWNEWLAEISRRIQAGTLDIMGHASYPPTTPSAFLITATSGSPNTVTIGCGRMYVDGLLAENHGQYKTASWDPALAELSNSPQPPNSLNPNPNPIQFTQQPYLPGATTPTDTGSYLAYLDVWTRAITYLEDPHLVDVAVGVDATGRLQTVWQVKLMANTGGWTCATPDSQIPYPASSAGQLTTNVVPNPTAGPCCLTDGSGYTGVENQFYRVEIHQGGQGSDTPTSSTATFKWSRDNASVETGVTAINNVQNTLGKPASQLTVMSLGRDQVLGFENGDWIEILDDWSELWGNPGVMCQIDSISFPNKTITLTTTVDTTAAAPGPGVPANFPLGTGNLTDPKRHTRIRRWDQSGKVYDQNGNLWCDLSTTGGLIPVPATKTLVLESGIIVQFGLSPATGNFNVADFWTFAARTADGSVEMLKAAPPRGIHHHYTKLSIVSFGSPASYSDCRTPWNPGEEGECGCCTCTVGDNVNSFGKFSSIQQAINSLPTTGTVVGGEVCILPGRYYEYISLEGLSDVVIHGCGAQTRIISPTLQPVGTIESKATSSGSGAESGFTAIITIIGCTNVELRDFGVEAGDDEAGILLDGKLVESHHRVPVRKGGAIDVLAFKGNDTIISEFPSNITITDLALTASTLPALLSVNVYLLKCTNNRIAMKDVLSQWASVYLCGTEIHFEKNWIGLEDASNASDWMPVNLVNDLSGNFNSANAPATPLANGGVHVAGGATDVYILDNEIEGGARNGVTLGSFEILTKGATAPTTISGLLPNMPDPSATTFSLVLPDIVTIGNQEQELVAGDAIQNIQIARNRIRNMGLCGIGPVGFFSLVKTIEVISVVNLTITGNTISGSLQDQLTQSKTTGIFSFGYGAICVPDVQNLVVRDNVVTDFGNTPGAQVCGIFVLNGEQVEISRNQVLETRDWSAVPNPVPPLAGAPQAGILIALVTPPPLDQVATASAWESSFAEGSTLAAPLYQPGLPALRIENNVVRVPLGVALEAIGFGPFSIVGNHLSSGGTVAVAGNPTLGTFSENTGGQFYSNVLTVEILNLGMAIEIDSLASLYSKLFNQGNPSTLQVGVNPLAGFSSGAVIFTNNICQLETRASGAQGIASVAVLTLDHLIFSNNHCWLDGSQTVVMDAMLVAGSLQVTSNRFQEAYGSVYVSGLTYGLSNITTYNTSTYCLFGLGSAALSYTTPNVVLDAQLCPDARKG